MKDTELEKRTAGMPEYAKELYEQAYKDAIEKYANPERAHNLGLQAIGREYLQENGEWVKINERFVKAREDDHHERDNSL